MSKRAGPQQFGGPWSLVKLAALQAYLSAFANVMKNKSFKTVYIDAFAGSGDFIFDAGAGGPLFNPDQAPVVHAGSARRALETRPPFHRLYFIENRRKNIAALKTIIGPDARAEVVRGDANEELERIIESIDWRSSRGVIFLDPFGNSLKWSTLLSVAKAKLDVWYLFPLAGVYRNAPIDKDKLTPEKRNAITRIVGTEEWEEAFYAPPTEAAATLFTLPASSERRTLNVDGIESFVKRRLEMIFPAVEPPLRLYGPTKAPFFSLFFAMTNKSLKAQQIAIPIARHILRQR